MSQTTRPTGPWFKDVKFSARQLFTALGKGLVNFATGKWSQVGVNVVEMVAAVGVQASPEERAWVLIQRAMVRAIHEQTRDVRRLIDINLTPDYEAIGRSLEARLDSLPVMVTGAFLEQPKKEPFVAEMMTVYREWLRALGLSVPRSEAEAARLPGYYVFALREESRRHAEFYKPLFDHLSGPFAKAADREAQWNVYRASLQRQVDQPVFDEPFSLRQIFVPLRGYYKLSTADRGRVKSDEGPAQAPSLHAVWLQQELEEWRRKEDVTHALRVLSGDPGSGKSSFAKMYADHLAEQGVCVIYVPLQLFKWKDDLADALTDFCKRDELLPDGVCHPKTGEPNLFVIFDGLDELAKQGRAAEEAAQQFVREVRNLLMERNGNEVHLRVLICGRPLSIQAVEGELRKAGQVLHVARYFLSAEDKKKFVNPEVLAEDQRQVWWQTFGALTGEPYGGLPKELAQPKLGDVTAQPLLNYLVALAFRRKRIDFTNNVNLNLVYADLLEAVYARAYERREDPRQASAKLMTFDEFKRVMQQVGLAAWHGNTRTTTATAIEKRCTTAGLETLLEKFREGAKSGVSRLLLAFYFQEHDPAATGEKSFEFTHKSFGEYLTAVAIVNALVDIQDEIDRRAATPGKGWDVREALKHWVTICGPTAMDENLNAFLAHEVAVRDNYKPNEARRWQETIWRLITEAMQRGVPMELLGPDRPGTFGEEDTQARNAEEALLAAHGACAAVTGCTSEPNDASHVHLLGTWLRRLQRRGPSQSPLLRHSFHHIPIANCDISFVFIAECNLSNLDCSRANMYSASMTLIIAIGANFSQSSMSFSDFSRSFCNCARFVRTWIEYALFYNAQAKGADFSYSLAHGANFVNSNVANAMFVDAMLRESTFRNANLQGADLRLADLRGADFRGADLRMADLRGANVTDALLSPEQLSSARYRPGDPDPEIEDLLKRREELSAFERSFRENPPATTAEAAAASQIR